MVYIPLDQCVHGGLYRIDSRNLSLGVYVAESKGFVGIREKFGNRYLFTEYHWDTGAPFGTVHPIQFLEQCPLEDLREHLTSIDWDTKKPVAFDKPIADGGKGWYFVDTGEASECIRATSIPNQALFDWLKEKEIQYPSDF